MTNLNHVAMSMPVSQLRPQDRADIIAFYSEVFGWSEYRSAQEQGHPLIIRLGEGGAQFLYVYPDEAQGARTRRMDHYGVEVDSEHAVDQILERAARYYRRDPRVEIIDKKVTHYVPGADASTGMRDIDLDVINGYIRYLLPLMVELQHFRMAPASLTGGRHE